MIMDFNLVWLIVLWVQPISVWIGLFLIISFLWDAYRKFFLKKTVYFSYKKLLLFITFLVVWISVFLYVECLTQDIWRRYVGWCPLRLL